MKLLVTMKHHETLIGVAKMSKSDNNKHQGKCGARAPGVAHGSLCRYNHSKHGLASFRKLGVHSTEGQSCEAKETHSQ